MNVLQFLMGLSNLLPVISNLVVAVEQTVPKVAGSDKLQIVKTTLQQAEGLSATALPVLTAGWPIVESLIGTIVSVFNKHGWPFEAPKPASDSAPAVPAPAAVAPATTGALSAG